MEGYAGLSASAWLDEFKAAPHASPLNEATEPPRLSMRGVIKSKNNSKGWALELAKMPMDDRRGNVARLTIAGNHSAVADLTAAELVELANAMLETAADLRDRELSDE